MRPQPKGEVHSAREDDCQTVPQRTEGSRGLVQTASARSRERAAENPERQAPRPLPVLRTSDELPQYLAVLSPSPTHLERMAGSSHNWRAADVGEVQRYPAPVSPTATSEHTCLAGRLTSDWLRSCTYTAKGLQNIGCSSFSVVVGYRDDISRRMSWNQDMSNPYEVGGYVHQCLNLVANGKPHGRNAKASNRTWEIRPSGIIGGPRRTWPWQNCDPISQPKG